MSKSRNWTAELFFAKSALKVKDDLTGFPLFERFELVNEAVDAIVGQLYGVLEADYRKSEEVGVEDNRIDLSSMRIMRAGNAVRITLEAGDPHVSGVPEAVSTEERVAFRPAAAQNVGRIIYEYEGGNDVLILAKADGITSYNNNDGKVIVHYPGMPDSVSAEGDYVDLPDGAIDLAMMRLELILAKRLGVQPKVSQQDMLVAVKNLYNSYQTTVSEEEIKKKTEALA